MLEGPPIFEKLSFMVACHLAVEAICVDKFQQVVCKLLLLGFACFADSCLFLHAAAAVWKNKNIQNIFLFFLKNKKMHFIEGIP